VGEIAEGCEARAVLVYADALDEAEIDLPDNIKGRVHYVTKTAAENDLQEDRGASYIHVPHVPMTRLGQIKIAVFLAHCLHSLLWRTC
jgi:hypothetical protein